SADRQRVTRRVDAEHAQVAGVAKHDADQHPQQRRLAGAVRADEAEQRAGLDGKRDVVDDPSRAKRLRDAGEDHGVGHAAISRRKLRSRSTPAGVRNDSGWNWNPWIGRVRWRSAMTMPSS